MVLRKGRISKEMVKKVAEFTSSIKQDCRLALYDIRQSTAHARALGKAGYISEKDSGKIIKQLESLMKKVEKDSNYFGSGHDDIHMAVEAELGELGKKLHAGRSRNDQVACDLRMFVKDSVERIIGGLKDAVKALKKKDADENGKEIIMPMYTHLQRGQAIDLSTYLGAYISLFERDIERFAELKKRVNVLPLGSGAGASTGIKLDWNGIAEELGFDSVIANPVDGVASRDYLIEFANAAALLGINLSRLAEDFVIYSSKEFGFIELDESIAETSSIMPQKKNPDCFELMRSASGRLTGAAVNLMTVVKGLPLTYNRDMQDDKAVFVSADTAAEIVELIPELMENIKFVPEKTMKAASEGFTDAADFAEYLVTKGMEFRTAHQKAGILVKKGLDKGYTSLRDFSLEELRAEADKVEEDVFNFIDIKNAVQRRIYKK